MLDLNHLYNIYVQNIARFPVLYDELAQQLNVSPESTFKIGTGLIPLDAQGNWSWTTPERNAKGVVIGLSKRLTGGSKYMVKGSKRGLIYAVNHDTTRYEKRQWTRVSTDHPCPLCDKPDGCLYPEEEYDNPNAVICVHISSGAAKPMKLGWLHILDPARQKLLTHNYSLLLPSEHPVLIVEGASDVCAAYDLGFTAVGKPAAASKSNELVELLSGRQVVIIGENDAGAGKAGMEQTFAQLQKACPNLTKMMPPEGIKDLRQWLTKGLTQAELLEYIEKAGSQSLSSDVFGSDIAYDIADSWIQNEKTQGGKLLLRIYRKSYVEFNQHCYKKQLDEQIRGQLYRYLERKKFIHSDGTIRRYKPTASKVRDILQACEAFCVTTQDAPCWLTPGDHPNFNDLIVFQNGVLDVNDYINGKITLHNPDPNLFSFNVLPYNFDENAESKLWEDTLADIQNGDKDRIALVGEWYGYSIVPDMSEQKLMFFWGPTGSGKGTLLAPYTAMLGKGNWCETSFSSLSGPHGYEPLTGKLAAVMEETDVAQKGRETAVLKRILNIVGRGAVTVNEKNKRHVPDVYLYCRFTFAMNDFPDLVDNAGAFRRRVIILPFENSYIGHEDKSLMDQLIQEAKSGKLINFALRGLKQLRKNREFTSPAISTLAMRSFQELVMPVPHFAQYCVEIDTTGPGVSVDYMYDLWHRWCKQEGLSVGKKSTFLRALRVVFPTVVQIMEEEVGNSERMLMGIKVTQRAIEKFEKGE